MTTYGGTNKEFPGRQHHQTRAPAAAGRPSRTMELQANMDANCQLGHSPGPLLAFIFPTGRPFPSRLLANLAWWTLLLVRQLFSPSMTRRLIPGARMPHLTAPLLLEVPAWRPESTNICGSSAHNSRMRWRWWPRYRCLASTSGVFVILLLTAVIPNIRRMGSRLLSLKFHWWRRTRWRRYCFRFAMLPTSFDQGARGRGSRESSVRSLAGKGSEIVATLLMISLHYRRRRLFRPLPLVTTSSFSCLMWGPFDELRRWRRHFLDLPTTWKSGDNTSSASTGGVSDTLG